MWRTQIYSFLLTVAASCLRLLAVALLISLTSCTSLFFKPGREYIPDAAVEQHHPREVVFSSRDGVTLTGWYFRARGRELGTILVCHGNVENMSTHVKLDLWLVDAGYNVFIFDYRGYGRSEGRPDVKGINLDAEAAIETVLLKLPREGTNGIILFGKSLGGAVAVYTAAHSPHKDRIKAVLLDSTFSSYRRIAREKIAESVIGWPFQHPLSFLVNDDYSPIHCIGKIAPVPLILMHGYDDSIVPLHHSRLLFDAAHEPKELWELTIPGHVKSWTDEATRARILAFLASLPDMP